MGAHEAANEVTAEINAEVTAGINAEITGQDRCANIVVVVVAGFKAVTEAMSRAPA